MQIEALWQYLLARVKEKFTGKVTWTFDKGVIVDVRRDMKEDLAQFK